MTTYNGAKYLEEQLDSFVTQRRQPDELVVCDDSSTDGTIDILERFRREAPFAVHVYRNEINLGHTRNFERALSLCGGDLIFLSDQDDVWDCGKIEKVLDTFNQNPRINVVVNDANYTDEALDLFGVTVLQKVISVGGGKNGNIAGACTAITRRFRDFILPFPIENCPQHDVYIHRWANLLGCKLVLDEPLQAWRIHGRNTTSDNEMSQPDLVPILERYRRSRDLDCANAYRKKADEFREMELILEERKSALSRLSVDVSIEAIRSNIESIIDAHLNRSLLTDCDWLDRKKLVFEMVVKGQYRHFKGLMSFAKDLLR